MCKGKSAKINFLFFFSGSSPCVHLVLHARLSFASVPLQNEKIMPVLQATLPSTAATKMLEKFPTPRHEGLDFLWGGGDS